MVIEEIKKTLGLTPVDVDLVYQGMAGKIADEKRLAAVKASPICGEVIFNRDLVYNRACHKIKETIDRGGDPTITSIKKCTINLTDDELVELAEAWENAKENETEEMKVILMTMIGGLLVKLALNYQGYAVTFADGQSNGVSELYQIVAVKFFELFESGNLLRVYCTGKTRLYTYIDAEIKHYIQKCVAINQGMADTTHELLRSAKRDFGIDAGSRIDKKTMDEMVAKYAKRYHRSEQSIRDIFANQLQATVAADFEDALYVSDRVSLEEFQNLEIGDIYADAYLLAQEHFDKEDEQAQMIWFVCRILRDLRNDYKLLLTNDAVAEDQVPDDALTDKIVNRYANRYHQPTRVIREILYYLFSGDAALDEIMYRGTKRKANRGHRNEVLSYVFSYMRAYGEFPKIGDDLVKRLGTRKSDALDVLYLAKCALYAVYKNISLDAAERQIGAHIKVKRKAG